MRGLGRRVLTVQADLADPGAAVAVVTAVVDEFGRLDILVNNAGITHWGSVAQTSPEDFDRVVAVDARAPFLMMQAAADILADGERVVNISSGVTATALAGIGLYSGAKAFLDQVTKVAAVEFAARRITVNAVAPGSTATGPFARLTDRQRGEAGASFGLGRIGEPGRHGRRGRLPGLRGRRFRHRPGHLRCGRSAWSHQADQRLIQRGPHSPPSPMPLTHPRPD